VRNTASVLFLLSFCNLIFPFISEDSGYLIKAFHTSQSKFVVISTDFVKNNETDTLNEVNSVKTLKPGQVYFRKKVLPGEYRIYRGEMNTGVLGEKSGWFVFSFPEESKLHQVAGMRFFRSPSDNPNIDEEEVCFDNERIYVKGIKKLCYYFDGVWFHIEGSERIPTGSVCLNSEPPGAEIVINGDYVRKLTPCCFDSLFSGDYIFELYLPDHHFLRKEVRVIPDSTSKLSYQLLSDFDTVYINGQVEYGILFLPKPPEEIPFKIDSVKIDSLEVRLSPGKHHIEWDGGSSYVSIDTTILISAGRLTWYDYIFKHRYGIVRIQPRPFDAEVCIGQDQCGVGEQILELETGIYKLYAYHYGFESLIRKVKIKPDTVNTIVVDMTQNADRDVDGFIDSVDKCPDVYGLYDGCPKRRLGDALQSKAEEIKQYAKNDPFTVGFSAFGFIMRIPTNKSFSNFLSTFSSGKIGGINNYRGLTFLNSFTVTYKGFFGSLELGQWAAGLQYQRNDSMRLSTDNKQYLIYYDSLSGVEPIIYIPSTSMALGFHFNWSRINVVYAIGYQFEDIVIDQVYDINEGVLKRFSFDNDWWYHILISEIDFETGEVIKPSAYFRVKFPFGPIKRTKWHVMQVGLQFKISGRKK
jgi:hypothetical protein